MIEKYRNVWYIKEGDKDVNKPFINDWLNDCNIKTYSLMDFIPFPMECPEHVFNLWNGFAIEKCEVEPNEDCSIMIEHISMLCNHDKAATDYLIKWLAHIIQYPGELNNIAVVLKSGKGVGKNIFTYFMRAIIGASYFSEITDEDELFGRFSNARKNRPFINVEEVGISFKNKDRLKNMITSKIYNHEAKGIDPIQMQNFGRLILTTNNDVPLPIEHNDRRIFLVSADNSKRNDMKYLKPLIDYCKNKANQKGFFNYLNTINLNQTDWVNDRPITEEYKDVQGMMTPLEARFSEFISNEKMKQDETTFKFANLYKDYKDYLVAHGYKIDVKDKTLGIQLKKYDGIVKKYIKGLTHYCINRDVLFNDLKKKSYNSIEELRDFSLNIFEDEELND
jgi:hypothetical protein